MQFTLSNVISQRFCDPEKGWIKKKFVLTEIEKTEFVKVFGYGCSQKTKDRLQVFIDNLEGQRVRAVHDWVIFYPDDLDGVICYFAGWSGENMAHTRKIMCGR